MLIPYTRRMRRLITIVMLILLPIHLSWATVAACCVHEIGQATGRLGTPIVENATASTAELSAAHGLAGDSKGQPPVSKGSIKPSQGEPDCGMCHLGKVHLSQLGMRLENPPADKPVFIAPPVSYTSFQPPALERPNWPGSV